MTHVLGVHGSAHCAPLPCAMHRPSNHLMRDWPKDYRRDWKVVTRVCPHGIQHPDPDDMEWLERKRQPTRLPRAHECDGCCREDAHVAGRANFIVLEDNDSLALFLTRWISDVCAAGDPVVPTAVADALIARLRERSRVA